MPDTTINQFVPSVFDIGFKPQNKLTEIIRFIYSAASFGSTNIFGRSAVKTNLIQTNNSITSWTTDLDQIDTADASIKSTDFIKLKDLQEKANHQLKEYHLMPLGWDGYDARQIDKNLADLAQFIVIGIGELLESDNRTPSEITPCPINDGSIDIEIGLPDFNKHIILTLNADKESASLYLEDNSIEHEEVFELTLKNLGEKLVQAVA